MDNSVSRTKEKKNIKWGVVLSYFSLAINLLGTLFITNRVLNLIGDYNYGLYSFVNSITTWLAVVSNALIASYLRYSSIESVENEGDVSRTNTIYFKLLFILSLIIMLFGLSSICVLDVLKVNIGKYSWQDSQLMYLLFAFSIINISISLPSTVFTQFIVFKKQFIFEKTIVIIAEILRFSGNFIIAYFTRNILFISIYAVVTTVLSLIFNYSYCKKKLNMKFGAFSFRENKILVTSIISFSSILVLNSIVDQINSNVDKTLLGIYSIPENVTIYQLGQQLYTYVCNVSIAISSIFAPKIHELCAKNDMDAVNNVFLKVSRFQAIVVCFVAFGFIASGKSFILWWVGESRLYSYYVGSVLMFLGIVPLSLKLSIDVQRAINKHKFRSYLYLTVAVLNVGLSILFINFFDPAYAIFACLSGTIISMLLCHWIGINMYNRKVIGLPMVKQYAQILKYSLFGVAGCIVVLIFKYNYFDKYNLSNLISFLIEGVIFVVVYCLFAFICDRRFLINTLKK